MLDEVRTLRLFSIGWLKGKTVGMAMIVYKHVYEFEDSFKLTKLLHFYILLLFDMQDISSKQKKKIYPIV